MEEMNLRIEELERKGVIILDPRQTYIAQEVDLSRVYSGAVLYPGCRLTGKRTLIGTGAKIGTEGPAMISNSIIGADAEIASGYLADTTILPRAAVGANSHFRAGTLLEEEATTAHCVGLKQTILMYSVTLGSLINFCDALLSGGSSRKNHTEVGSGFIHFNFTPWGVNGDKATPSLVGNVTEGVFLDQPKIFMGGMSGMVGPNAIGFGATTVAGQVVRHPVEEGWMHAETGRNLDCEVDVKEKKFSENRMNRILERNTEYLVQLYALKKWYAKIRLPRSQFQKNEELSLVYSGAMETIDACIKERLKRYNALAQSAGMPLMREKWSPKEFADISFILDWKTDMEYDQWIWGLTSEEKEQLHDWLTEDLNRIRKELLISE